MIRSSVLIACTALAGSCAQSAPVTDQALVSAHVVVSRIVSANIPPRPSGCAIETLAAMPAQPYRELGTIQVSEAGPDPSYINVIVDHFACKMGADAVVPDHAQANPGEGALNVTAIAYMSNLAERAAQNPAGAVSTDLNEESHGPGAQFPEAEVIPASDDSTSSTDLAQPAAPASMTEQQSGAPETSSESPSGSSSETTSPASEASPSAALGASAASPVSTPAASAVLAPVAGAPLPAATASPNSSQLPSASESPGAAQSPSASASPAPSPAGSSLISNNGAGPGFLPLPAFKIVPEDSPDDEEVPASPETSP